MAIKIRRNVPKPKPVKRRLKKRVHVRGEPTIKTADALVEMRALLSSGYGTEEHARAYFKAYYMQQVSKLQSIIARAEQERSWKFMHGHYMQCAELYVLASVLYEKYPEHVMMTDAAYDNCARFLLRNFDKLKPSFREWYTITCVDLRASTGHAVTLQEPIRWMVYLITGDDIPNVVKVKPKRKHRRVRSRT